jgi:hypothetical protein
MPKALYAIGFALLLGQPAGLLAEQRQASGAAAAPLVVSPGAGSIVTVHVDGRPRRLRVDPGIGLALNPGAAARAGLTGGIFSGTIVIGPVQIQGNSSLARLQIGEWTGRRRIFWFDRDIVEGADGTIGMADLPDETVTLQLREPQAGEQRYQFRVRQGGLMGLVYRHRLGDRDVDVQFRPIQPITQASAAVGALLGQLHNGTWSAAPREELITMGVSRPVRPMRLATPLSLNGFMVHELLIRIDYRGNYVLPADPPAVVEAGDPNEVVVVGRSRGRGRAAFRLTFGADQLSGCSSITYSKTSELLTLVCRRNPAQTG